LHLCNQLMFFAGSLLQNSQRRRVHRPTLGPCMNSKQLRRVPAHRSNACSRYEHARGGSLVRPRPLPAGSKWQSRAVPPPSGSKWQSRASPPARWQFWDEIGPKTARNCHLGPRTARNCHLDTTSRARSTPAGSKWQSRASPPARWQFWDEIGPKTARNCHLDRKVARDCHLGARTALNCHLGREIAQDCPPPPGNRSQDCAGASSEPASSSYSACSWASSDSVEDANLVERKAL
jgi:hypothetical protein